ncbi:hypothetical protein [Lentilactobacillus sp. SPB1-3]|uniref:Uncharacterized protein n=1 Tax=Lentilactobacillus terminaliae TaxID=3003483 RepID=A0ACD5DCI5_9LACO|nr:hypothetical protein [Lentilactobacillus sp. SPB1-3]MCZ0978115.1 hypothetical protein [Lentilactobacillus sp. SPB1-3]
MSLLIEEAKCLDEDERDENDVKLSSLNYIDDFETAENVTNELGLDITEEMYDYNGNAIDFETEMSKRKEDVREFENEVQTVQKVIDDIEKLDNVEIIKHDLSNLTISTYLTINFSGSLEQFENDFVGFEFDEDTIEDYLNNEKPLQLKVRISDHESGSKAGDYGRINYDEGDLSFIF